LKKEAQAQPARRAAQLTDPDERLPELGHFAFDSALAAGGFAGLLWHLRARIAARSLLAAVAPAVAGQFVMVATAIACLVTAFVSHDFSVRYVPRTRTLRCRFSIASPPCGARHEGSLLLWIFLLACWTLAGGRRPLHACRRVWRARRCSAYSVWLTFGFLLFTLATRQIHFCV